MNDQSGRSLAPGSLTRLSVTAAIGLLSRAFALCAALLALSGTAYGHAVVLETVPADGAVLQRAPDEIVVRFNEPVRPLAAQILNVDGEDVTPADAARVEHHELRITLPPSLADGSYVVSYRGVSIDSHPVSGAIIFSVGQASSRFLASPTVTDDRGWTMAMMAVRLVLYASILGGTGGLLFLLLIRPAEPVPARGTRRIVAAFAAIGSLAAFLAIGVHGGLLLGGPANSLAEPATWWTGLRSSFGAAAVAAMLGLAAVVAGLSLSRPALRSLAYVGAAAALASFALSGHVVTAGPRWLTVPVLIAHTAAVAFWAGALMPLLHGLRVLGKDGASAVERFSRVAVGAVVILVIAGLVIAVLQVRSLANLVDTTYGLALLAKIGFVTGLIALAAFNKLRLTPALVRGESDAARALSRTIVAELALVGAVLAATAGLGTTLPPRALGDGAGSQAGYTPQALRDPLAAASEAEQVHVHGTRAMADVFLLPARAGPVDLTIKPWDSNHEPLIPIEVSVRISNPEAGVEPIRRSAYKAGDVWKVDDLVVPLRGYWLLEIELLITDFEKVTIEGVVEIE
jgi:copper transport protein